MGRYDISGDAVLKGGEYKTIHAGFDPAAADADPNVITPVDALKELEKEGVFGSFILTFIRQWEPEQHRRKQRGWQKRLFHI